MVWAVPLSLATTDGIDSLSFPADTEMFHFSACRSIETIYSSRSNTELPVLGSPFGNLRIKACMPLPEAFRSLLRPSSPDDAKASIICCNWFMQTRSILGVYFTHLLLHISKLDIMLSV